MENKKYKKVFYQNVLYVLLATQVIRESARDEDEDRKI